MASSAEIRWIQIGVVAGLLASVLYPLLQFAPLPLAATLRSWHSIGWAREQLKGNGR